MSLAPGTQGWAWGLERPCPECGFDASAVTFEAVPPIVRRDAASWQAVLAGPGVRRRPQPQVWSPLEYGCHVRDVLLLFDLRFELMLTQADRCSRTGTRTGPRCWTGTTGRTRWWSRAR